MGMSGVGNGSVAKPSGVQNGDGLKSGAKVASPSGPGYGNTGQRSGALVASPSGNNSGNGWKSGDKVASPAGTPGGAGLDGLKSGQSVAAPKGGGGSNTNNNERIGPKTTGAPRLDPRDFLPGSSK